MDRRFFIACAACFILWSAGCSNEKPVAAPEVAKTLGTPPANPAAAAATSTSDRGAPPAGAATTAADKKSTEKKNAGKVKHVGKSIITSSGLEIEDVKVGTGPMPHTGQRVFVDYIGILADGTQFDSSFNRQDDYSFVLGMGEVIKGWDEGVATMRVGGKRMLVVPPQLAYGQRVMGKIPPNSTLTFIISLRDIGKP